jgi:hypothetical protein
MIHTPPAPKAGTSEPREALDPREIKAVRRLAVAERMSEIGLAMAEAMLERVCGAMNSGEPVDMGAASLEFSRLELAVDRALALQRLLDADIAALATGLAAERATRLAEDERRRERRIRAHTDCVQTAVRQAIKADPAVVSDKTRAKRLTDGLLRYLNDPREEDTIADLSVSALVAKISETLGLTVDWSLWEDEDWAVAEWREGVAGSPYAPSEPRATNGSPSGGAAREAGGGGFQATPSRPPGPLHHVSRGPPPPMGEELGRCGVAVSLDGRLP